MLLISFDGSLVRLVTFLQVAIFAWGAVTPRSPSMRWLYIVDMSVQLMQAKLLSTK